MMPTDAETLPSIPKIRSARFRPHREHIHRGDTAIPISRIVFSSEARAPRLICEAIPAGQNIVQIIIDIFRLLVSQEYFADRAAVEIHLTSIPPQPSDG